MANGIEVGSNIQAAMDDPNGAPGTTRGGVATDVQRQMIRVPDEINQTGPPGPVDYGTFTDPIQESFQGVGPEG